MMSLTTPKPELRYARRLRQQALAWTYPNPGCTRTGEFPKGYDIDSAECRLGSGEAVFARARLALRDWRQFPSSWVSIDDPRPHVQTGSTLTLTARAMGIWWVNACRIVYVLDEPRRFAFAYGTLPGHVEQGEERFQVEQRPDGSVWYSILAVSRPRHWAARLGYPIARVYQWRFRRDSLRSMQLACGS